MGRASRYDAYLQRLNRIARGRAILNTVMPGFSLASFQTLKLSALLKRRRIAVNANPLRKAALIEEMNELRKAKKRLEVLVFVCD